MNFSLFRHELKLMIQSRKNILFILFFLIAIFSYIFILLPNEENIETIKADEIEATVMELESMQAARESRRHTGGGYASVSFYSNNNYNLYLQSGMLQSLEDENYQRFAYLRTFYLYSVNFGQIFNDELFQDSEFPSKDRAHYINKKVRENKALLEADLVISRTMIEEKTALQTMKNIFLSFGPFLLLFAAIYFSNDLLVRDREQTSTVQGLPISWYQYINTKSFVAFVYSSLILSGLTLITILTLSLVNGFGSFQMEVPILSVLLDGEILFIHEYSTISILKYFVLVLSFLPVFMLVFIRLNMIFSLFFKNEWIVILLSSLLLFSERFYYARDARTLFGFGIENFPQTFFDFGKIITGEKNFLINMSTLTYGKGILIMFISFILVEVLLFLSMKIVTKDRFFNV